MKQRTRIATAIMIGLYSWNVFAALVSVLMGKSRGTLFETADFGFGAILGVLLNAAIVIGCIYLLKNRRWAWTMLVWLTAIFSLGMLSPGLELILNLSPGLTPIDRSNSVLSFLLFLPFPYGWVSIPALVFLLTDKPEGWSKQRIAPNSTVQAEDELKQRTRVIAWIYLVLSAMAFVSLPIVAVASRHKPSVLLSSLPEAFLWVLWVGLMQKRVWSWCSLVIAYAVLSIWYGWDIAQVPAYYATHPSILSQQPYAMISSAVRLILMILIPLWALLTDRPSGWANPKSSSATASAGNPK